MFKNATAPKNMSEECWISLFLYYSRIPNTGFHPDYVRKRTGLMMIGLPEMEVEELCRPKEADREQMMRNVMEEQERELRRLAKWSREQRKSENRQSEAFPNFEIDLGFEEECGEPKL